MRTNSRTDSRPRAAGFTLVELMIVIVASSLVIAGAFALHQSFSRQTSRLQKVAEVQQTLRVARGYIERQLRLAGSGFGRDNTFKVPVRSVSGNCENRQIGGVMFHNLNNYFPTVPDFGHLSEYDPDPDWFEFAYMDVNSNPATLKEPTSGSSVEFQVNNIQALANYQECSAMISLGQPGGFSCVYALRKSQSQADKIQLNPNGCHENPCMDDIAIKSADDCLCGDGVDHGSGATDHMNNPDFVAYRTTFCNANPSLNAQQCQTEACKAFVDGTPVQAIGPGLGGVRLVPANEVIEWAPTGSAASAFGFPILARAKLETDKYTWHQLTELLEDMQFEIFLDNGTVIGSLIDGNNRRDVVGPTDVPTYGPLNEWPKMRAVRYTLVARSRTQVELGSAFTQTIPRYADRPGGTYTDGYLRRMVQGVVQLRNYGL